MGSFSKWPEIHQSWRAISTVTINFLYEQFSRYGLLDEIISDNTSQFTASKFRRFCEAFAIIRRIIMTPSFHPRSNDPVERFVDTFKRGLKKSGGVNNEEEKSSSSCECIRWHQIEVLRWICPHQANVCQENLKKNFWTSCYQYEKSTTTSRTTKLRYLMLVTRFFKLYWKGKGFWQNGVITKRDGRFVCMVRGSKWEDKRHINQLRRWYVED